MTEALQARSDAGKKIGAACSPGLSLAVGRAMGTVVVTLHGTIDAAGAAVLRSVLRDLIDEQGNLDVVVDLRRVVIADADADAVFGQAFDWAARHGGRLRLHQRRPARRADSAARDERGMVTPGAPAAAFSRAARTARAPAAGG